MGKVENYIKSITTFSLLLGALYILGGVLELLIAFNVKIPETAITSFEPDILSAFILIVIGGIFLHGFMKLRRGEREALGFPLTATILAVGLFVLYTLILLGHAFEAYVLQIEDYGGWSLTADLKPEVYLILFVIPVVYYFYKLVYVEKAIKPI